MRAYLPAVGVGVFIITLITCEALAARSSYWSGDLPLPYISDTGRDGANYACFATGGTISALLLLLQMVWLNPGYAHAVKREQTSTSGWYCPWLTGSILSTPALVGLILLCVFNTNDYESLHAYAAYTFFVLMAFALPCFTVAAIRLRRAKPEAMSAISVGVKLAICVLFWVSFIIYLPVGLAINCAWLRLPYDDCVNTHQLGAAYCTTKLMSAVNNTACIAPPCTVLWDYGGCPGTNTLRSSTQLVCVVLLLGFCSTFCLENKYAVAAGETPAPGKDVKLSSISGSA